MSRVCLLPAPCRIEQEWWARTSTSCAPDPAPLSSWSHWRGQQHLLCHSFIASSPGNRARNDVVVVLKAWVENDTAGTSADRLRCAGCSDVCVAARVAALSQGSRGRYNQSSTACSASYRSPLEDPGSVSGWGLAVPMTRVAARWQHAMPGGDAHIRANSSSSS